ncbi:MAG: hypothetical protein ACOYWZ_22370 [Bacillota bacterium]
MSIPSYKISLNNNEHIYTVELSDGKVIHPISFSKLCNDYGLIPSYHGDSWFGQRGTAIHIGTVLIDKDDLDWDTVQDEIKPFLEAYMKFKYINAINREQNWQYIETSFYHPKWNFCTTIDRALPVIDIKSGQGYPIQLAVHGEILRVNDIEPGPEAFMLTLKENGSYNLQSYKYYKLKDELEDFKSACRLNIRKEKLCKT